MLLDFPQLAKRRQRQQAGVGIVAVGSHPDAAHAGGEPVVGIVGGPQDGAQGIVVPLGQRIELVVVAAGASQRQPHGGGAQDLNLGGQHIQAFRQVVLLGAVGRVRSHSQKSGGHQQVRLIGAVGLHGLVVEQLIPGKLFGQEPVVGLVGIQGPYDVVAVTEGVGPDFVGRNPTFGIGVAHGVQPVAGPALAVVGRFQKKVHQPFVSPRVGIGQVGSDLFGGRRKAHQVEMGPPHQGETVGRRGKLQALRFQSSQQEGVHRIPDAVLSLHPGFGRPARELKGPELPVLGDCC